MTKPGGWAKLRSEIMGLTATARSIPGTLRQEVVIAGEHRLITDEPERLGGEGSGPAPHELFPAALASCISTTLVMYARTKGWELGEVSVAVDYDNRSTPRRFEVAVELGGALTDEQLRRLEKVAASCPVRRAVESGVEFVETIARRDSGPRALTDHHNDHAQGWSSADRGCGEADGDGGAESAAESLWTVPPSSSTRLTSRQKGPRDVPRGGAAASVFRDS